jgi:hypothetical protein
VASRDEYQEYERRIFDIGRDANYALWNALLTLNGIIISVFSAVAVFSAEAKLLIFIIVALSMLSAILLILNFRSVRNQYRLIAQTMNRGVEHLSADERKQDIADAHRGYRWCSHREMATTYILILQAVLILILISIKS